MKEVMVSSIWIEPNERIPHDWVYFDYRLGQLIIKGIIFIKGKIILTCVKNPCTCLFFQWFKKFDTIKFIIKKAQSYLLHMYRFQEGNVAQDRWYKMKCYWKHTKEYIGNKICFLKILYLGPFPKRKKNGFIWYMLHLHNLNLKQFFPQISPMMP